MPAGRGAKKDPSQVGQEPAKGEMVEGCPPTQSFFAEPRSASTPPPGKKRNSSVVDLDRIIDRDDPGNALAAAQGQLLLVEGPHAAVEPHKVAVDFDA